MCSARRFALRAFFSACILLSPLGAFGASFSLPESMQHAPTVSRAEFLRAAVQAFALPVIRRSEPQREYGRPVPRALAPYVRSAERKQALDALGTNVSWSLPVTRGEAVRMVAILAKIDPPSSVRRFSDVKKGSALEAAVGSAIELQWMRPLRSSRFGADVPLTGRDALRLLEQASEIEKDVPVVHIEILPPQISEGDILQTVRRLLEDQYLYTDKLESINGEFVEAESLVKSLDDPYTVYMRPADSHEFQVQLEGEVIGIGAQVEMIGEALVIVSPLSGSPAEKVGLLSGDIILGVDNQSLQGLTFLEAVSRVRGPAGSSVVLTIRRDGNEFNVTVERDVIRVPDFEISTQDNIAVVKLSQFGQMTDTQLRSLMGETQELGPRGIVLDLRNNPGGLLHAAEIVLSNFLPEGSGVARILSRDDSYTQVTLDPPTIDALIPMVVLVNRGSASASEIVAGALQDAKRATVIGEQTFGKGTVQQIIEFSDGSSIKMTIAEWQTPAGRVIDGAGIRPDEIVVQSDDGDAQLQRALDLLR